MKLLQHGRALLFVSLLSLTVSSCGGGGGGSTDYDSSNSSTQATAPSALGIPGYTTFEATIGDTTHTWTFYQNGTLTWNQSSDSSSTSETASYEYNLRYITDSSGNQTLDGTNLAHIVIKSHDLQAEKTTLSIYLDFTSSTSANATVEWRQNSERYPFTSITEYTNISVYVLN